MSLKQEKTPDNLRQELIKHFRKQEYTYWDVPNGGYALRKDIARGFKLYIDKSYESKLKLLESDIFNNNWCIDLNLDSKNEETDLEASIVSDVNFYTKLENICRKSTSDISIPLFIFNLFKVLNITESNLATNSFIMNKQPTKVSKYVVDTLAGKCSFNTSTSIMSDLISAYKVGSQGLWKLSIHPKDMIRASLTTSWESCFKPDKAYSKAPMEYSMDPYTAIVIKEDEKGMVVARWHVWIDVETKRFRVGRAYGFSNYKGPKANLEILQIKIFIEHMRSLGYRYNAKHFKLSRKAGNVVYSGDVLELADSDSKFKGTLICKNIRTSEPHIYMFKKGWYDRLYPRRRTQW